MVIWICNRCFEFMSGSSELGSAGLQIDAFNAIEDELVWKLYPLLFSLLEAIT